MALNNYQDADFSPSIEPSNVRPNMGTYNTPQSFRFWCQKVLPLVYDDSLSYYELLCKVVDYLNKTMEDVNTAVQDVSNLNDAFGSLENHVNASETALLQAYNDLQTYVNTYFNNLDVQEEINNKLDAMVADGTMDEIILPYFNEYVETTDNRINAEFQTQNNILTAQTQNINTLRAEFNEILQVQTSGDLPTMSEVIDARVGANGFAYDTLGDCIRGQIVYIGEPYTEENAQNLFNQYAVERGYYYNASGVRTALSTYCNTGFIPLKPNSYYRLSSHGIYNYYNANKEWITSETKNSSVIDYTSGINTTAYPERAYVIISTEITNIDRFMLVNTNIQPTEWKAYQYENKMRLKNNSVKAEWTEFSKPYYSHGNIFESEKAHFEGYYYNQQNVKTVFAEYGYTDLIPAYEGIRYYLNAPCFICFYDEDEAFISGTAVTNSAGGAFDTPATTKFVRLSVDRRYHDTFIVSTNPLVNDIPFKYTINDEYLRVPLTTDGKKIVCVGDSLTLGIDYQNHAIKENYPYFMSNVLGCGIVNYGKSGTSSLAWWQNYSASCPFDPTMDVVLIMFGTNGGLQNNTLDVDVEPYSNWQDYADTSVGCYCKLIEHIMEDTNNHAQIILMTPPYSTYSTSQENTVIQSESTIRAIAKRYQLPVIDVLNECGIGKFNGSTFRPHDGCHFNAKGYHKLGTFIASRLLSYFSEFNLNESYPDETT